jgi:hypothetical protein
MLDKIRAIVASAMEFRGSTAKRSAFHTCGVLCIAREEAALTANREIALNPRESAEAIVREYGTPENESASFGHWECQNGHASSWPTLVADFEKSPGTSTTPFSLPIGKRKG